MATVALAVLLAALEATGQSESKREREAERLQQQLCLEQLNQSSPGGIFLISFQLGLRRPSALTKPMADLTTRAATGIAHWRSDGQSEFFHAHARS